jgi:hypothetical protein
MVAEFTYLKLAFGMKPKAEYQARGVIPKFHPSECGGVVSMKQKSYSLMWKLLCDQGMLW